MEKYWEITKDYIDSKLNDFPLQRKESNVGTWITAITIGVGLSVIAYKYKSTLNKILNDIKDASLDKLSMKDPATTEHSINEPTMHHPLQESGI